MSSTAKRRSTAATQQAGGAKQPACRCGHTKDHFWVSPQARYSLYGFVMGVFMGLSGTMPKSIRFVCRKCGQIVEERYDKASIKAYREH